MDMIDQNIALLLAGVVGAGVAIFHGIVMQRHMVRPIDAALARSHVSLPIRRLVSPLLHISTIAWLIGGLALIAVGGGWAPHLRLAVALVVGGFYLHAMVMNGWATRGRHPGWVLMGAALVLIVAGIRP
ncbi:hypothetical protein [Sphingopyxis sp.]|jgi:hypothetical protein|uniref:hypothetical protein n=1 Tax=Sphingopyxis sp. TaxID=1908224 RepID=UPI003F6F401C